MHPKRLEQAASCGKCWLALQINEPTSKIQHTLSLEDLILTAVVNNKKPCMSHRALLISNHGHQTQRDELIRYKASWKLPQHTYI